MPKKDGSLTVKEAKELAAVLGTEDYQSLIVKPVKARKAKKEPPPPPPPKAPASDMIPILGLRDALLACTDCGLRAGCKSPVPWSGPRQASILAFGEGPGATEDLTLTPFTGAAGHELDGYFVMAGIDRNDVRVSNTVRCRPPNNRDPYPQEVAACRQWTLAEIEECDPELIILLGGSAIRAFFGPAATVDDYHGFPLTWEHPVTGKTYPVFPTMHPAAGLHNGRDMRTIQEDFRTLRQWLKGDWQPPADEYPDPHYLALTSEDVDSLAREILREGHVSVDTEFEPDGSIWCATFCINPGESYLVWPDDLPKLKEALESARVTMHFDQADVDKLAQAGIVVGEVDDTMLMAYLLNKPQALKTIARTEFGMSMQSYGDLVGPYQRALEVEFFTAALEIPFLPTPPPGSRRRSIASKLDRVLKDLEKDTLGEVDPRERWKNWTEAGETEIITELVGPYPQATLRHVPLEAAIYYACRDADATQRAANKFVVELQAWNSFSGGRP